MTTAIVVEKIADVDQPARAPGRCRSAVPNFTPDRRRSIHHRHHSQWTLAILAAGTIIQAIFLFSFYAPAHGGTDQNGYHVTARLLSEGNGASFVPKSPFTFVGNMMVLLANGRVYAKYPPGYPLLAAAARLLGGAAAVYWVNPICTVLACTCSFFLFRTLLDDFTSILAVFWLSWNPLILNYANDGNSHASELLFIIAGTSLLLRSLRDQSRWRCVLGAFCLGYAGTIRYSEIVLWLPVLFVVALNLWSSSAVGRRQFVDAMIALIGWSIPIALLACFCWSAFGAPWRTGYTYCAEDSGFGWKYFIGDPLMHRPGNWETFFVQLNWMGLLMLWPVGLAGAIALVGTRWREGIFIILWVIPSVALYLCYYWAPTGETSLGYLRFFIAVIPALILTGIWLIGCGVQTSGPAGRLALGLITAIGVSVNLWNTAPSLESSLAARQAVAQATRFVDRHAPRGSSLFIADEGLCNSLDAAGGYTLYDLKLFRNASFTAFDRILDDPTKAGEPDPRQRSRISLYRSLIGTLSGSGEFAPKSNETLSHAEDEMIEQSLRAGGRVFVLLCTGQNLDLLPDETRWRSVSVANEVCYPSGWNVARALGGLNGMNHIDLPVVRKPNPITWTLYEVRRKPA